jgi:hypothetical protein
MPAMATAVWCARASPLGVGRGEDISGSLGSPLIGYWTARLDPECSTLTCNICRPIGIVDS